MNAFKQAERDIRAQLRPDQIGKYDEIVTPAKENVSVMGLPDNEFFGFVCMRAILTTTARPLDSSQP